MISTNCEIADFLQATEGKDIQEIIELADREATEAERCLYRSGAAAELKNGCGRQYAQCLKDLIFFMRYGIKPAGLDPAHLALFRSITLNNGKPMAGSG